MKDKESPFRTLGASNHCLDERQEDDFYATQPIAVEKLLSKLTEKGITLPTTCIEPSVGSGNIASVLTEAGHTIIGYDIVDRGYSGVHLQDFLTVNERPEEPIAIVANFPYKDLLKHTIHSLELLKTGEYLCSLTKIQFLEGKSRYEGLFKTMPPKYIFIFSERVNCYKDDINTGKTSAICYCWGVFEKGYTGLPMIDWITGSNK